MKKAREGETKAGDMKEANLIAIINLATRNEGRKEGRQEGRKEWRSGCMRILQLWHGNSAEHLCSRALALQVATSLPFPPFFPSLSLSLSLSPPPPPLVLYSHGSCTLAYHLPSSCIISFLPFHFFGKHSKKFLSVFLSLNLEGTIYSWISLLRKKTVLVPTPWE